MTTQEKDRIECAIRHIQTAVDVDPWAVEIAVKAMKTQLSAEGTTSDLISRQDAIDRINKQREHLQPDIYPQDKIGDAAYRICAEFIERLPSAHPEIEERTEEFAQNVPKEDLISRKEAIDAECEVCQIAPKKERGHNCTYYDHGCKEIECLRELPSAQPEIVRCKECKYRGGLSGFYCDIVEKAVGVDSFCSWADRRTDDLQ